MNFMDGEVSFILMVNVQNKYENAHLNNDVDDEEANSEKTKKLFFKLKLDSTFMFTQSVIIKCK